jgi:hypothetical protein
MQNILQRSLKFGLLLAAFSLGLTACPTADAIPPIPKPVDSGVAADGGTPQLQGWSAVLKGAFLFFGSGSTKLNEGSIGTDGKFTFKLPTVYPVATALVKANVAFGTGCTINPPDADVAIAFLYVQSQAETVVHDALIYLSPTADYNTVHQNDEVVQFWMFASKAFTVTGTKGCSAISPRLSLDANFRAGWNYAVEKFLNLNPDGSILEGKLRAVATLPTGFRWFENPIAAASSPILSRSGVLNLTVLPNLRSKP